MERKCPQCGKSITVSPEELAMHDNQVVCPQCLSVYHVEGNTLTPQQVSTTRGTSHAGAGHGYCYNCGKPLPSGINFCPYCGVDLMKPFAGTVAEQPVQEQVEQQPSQASAADDKSTSDTSSRQNYTSRERGDILRQMNSYRDAVNADHARKHGKASPRFQAFAWTLIVLLAVLFVCIVIAGNNIQPA